MERKFDEMTINDKDVDENTADGANDGWDDADADWGSLEDSFKPDPEPVRKTSASSFQPAKKNSASSFPDDDFASSGAWKRESAKSKPTDDWDSWGDPVPIGNPSQNDDKALKEEKRAQRRAELQAKREARKAGGGGPMKLGSKRD